MSIFGNSTLPGWQMFTPSSYALAAAPANAEIGRSFQRAFESAQDNKTRQDELAERKREFDAANPAMPTDRAGTSPGANWNGEAPTSSWQNFKFNSPTEAIGAVLGAKNVDEAATIRQANADWEANPTYRKWMDDAFKAPIAREQAVNQAERLKIAKQTAENHTVASQILVKDASDFNKRVGVIDPESRASIISMSKNPDGTISAGQWRALSMAEEAAALRKENARKQAEAEALARGDQQRTVISDKGVTQTFTPAPPVKPDPAEVEPMTKTLANGDTVMWMPGSKGLHVVKKTGEKMPATAYQLNQIAKSLDDSDPDKTNFVAMAKALIKGQAMPPTPAAKNSAPPPAETPAAPKGQKMYYWLKDGQLHDTPEK